MDAGGYDGFTAPAVIKSPWLPVVCFGLVFVVVPRILWVAPDTHCVRDPSRTVNTGFFGGGYSPGVSDVMERTGEEVGNGERFQTSCALGG